MDVLYHYCPTAAFHSIIQTRSIWLSSLTLANDTMEGKLVTGALTRLAQRDGLDRIAVERLKDSVALLEGMFDGLGFCLSEDGDLLSQWRGYAADATGVAIGFSRAHLQTLANSSSLAGASGFSLGRVEYSSAGHETQVEPTYRQVRRYIDDGAFKIVGPQSLLDSRTGEEIEEERKRIEKAHSSLLLTLLTLLPKLFFLKAHAFSEEKEWRLVSFLVWDVSDDCLYRLGADRVIPYRRFELAKADPPPIAEVVLGPKHQTPNKAVVDFLKSNGFSDVPVRRSEATYR